jgi:hypothetical protein
MHVIEGSFIRRIFITATAVVALSASAISGPLRVQAANAVKAPQAPEFGALDPNGQVLSLTPSEQGALHTLAVACFNEAVRLVAHDPSDMGYAEVLPDGTGLLISRDEYVKSEAVNCVVGNARNMPELQRIFQPAPPAPTNHLPPNV